MGKFGTRSFIQALEERKNKAENLQEIKKLLSWKEDTKPNKTKTMLGEDEPISTG
jgi:hypothetical protein